MTAQALEKIVEWAKDGKPLWVQDAVRRLIENNELSDTDINELLAMCKEAHGLDDPANPAPSPTPPAVGEATEQNDDSVCLLGVSNVDDVNALANDQNLRLEPGAGLTVIYGDNGSGKSSYTRILKHACHTRGNAPDIHGNVLNPSDSTPSSDIAYQVNDSNEMSFQWSLGTQSNPHLKAINVFDTSAAIDYVSEEDGVAFRPYGLDILDKLGRACAEIKRLLDQELHMISTPIDLKHLEGDTSVGKLVASLSKSTEGEDVDGLASLDEEELSRIEELQKQIAQLVAEDPLVKARSLKQKATRLRSFKDKLAVAVEYISSESIAKFQKNAETMVVEISASELAAKEQFGSFILKGVGSGVWRSLWDSARAYSEEHAYPDIPFPNLNEGSVCPLCQQELSKDARDRFVSFDEFVKGEAKKKADAAALVVEQIKADLRGALGFQEELSTLEDIAQEDEPLAQQLTTLTEHLSTKIEAVLKSIETGEWSNEPSEKMAGIPQLEVLIGSLENSATEFEKASENNTKKSLEDELLELTSRQLLAKSKDSVLKEIKRRQTLDGIHKCRVETRTDEVTVLSRRLTKELVTDALCHQLKGELKELGFHAVKIEVKTRGDHGNQYHRLKLAESADTPLMDLLSEGEQRCLALASMLSETTTSPHKSAIVFDDPVSSLDHKWRLKIARRIVRESLYRQVVVFTHDMTFLIMLQEEAAKLEGSSLCLKSLTRKRCETGIARDGAPWEALGVKERVGVLKQRLVEIRRIEDGAPEDDYKHHARVFYGLLRETWERGIEELLLNKVITRFGREVQTQRVKRLVDITTEDYDQIDSAMSKCSKYLIGHDSAAELNEPLPDSNEIEVDLSEFEEWMKAMRKRGRS